MTWREVYHKICTVLPAGALVMLHMCVVGVFGCFLMCVVGVVRGDTGYWWVLGICAGLCCAGARTIKSCIESHYHSTERGME